MTGTVNVACCRCGARFDAYPDPVLGGVRPLCRDCEPWLGVLHPGWAPSTLDRLCATVETRR